MIIELQIRPSYFTTCYKSKCKQKLQTHLSRNYDFVLKNLLKNEALDFNEINFESSPTWKGSVFVTFHAPQHPRNETMMMIELTTIKVIETLLKKSFVK